MLPRTANTFLAKRASLVPAMLFHTELQADGTHRPLIDKYPLAQGRLPTYFSGMTDQR